MLRSKEYQQREARGQCPSLGRGGGAAGPILVTGVHSSVSVASVTVPRSSEEAGFTACLPVSYENGVWASHKSGCSGGIGGEVCPISYEVLLEQSLLIDFLGKLASVAHT